MLSKLPETRGEQKLLIAFEGIDGSGKTTLIREVIKRLQSKPRKYKCQTYRGLAYLEDVIKEVYGNWPSHPLMPEIMGCLFTADRMLIQTQLQEWSKSYDIIIADRYILSTLAYQGAMGGNIEYLRRLQSMVLKPSLTFFLDVDPETALERRKIRGEEDGVFEQEDFQRKVYEQYKLLCAHEVNLYQVENENLKKQVRYVTNVITRKLEG